MPTTEELKACPFCGSAAHYSQWCGEEDPIPWQAVACKNVNCGASFVSRSWTDKDLRESLSAAWNRRSALPQAGDATALAQAQPAAPQGVQQPVAWRWKEFSGFGGSPRIRYHEERPQGIDAEEVTPLYAAPLSQGEEARDAAPGVGTLFVRTDERNFAAVSSSAAPAVNVAGDAQPLKGEHVEGVGEQQNGLQQGGNSDE